MKAKAYAKINLSLYVTGRRNGLHTLDSIMASVSAFDEVTVRPSDAPASRVVGMDVPAEREIALRAARMVYDACGLALDVTVEKGIPSGGGMGGSSADGAAVLVCAHALAEREGKTFDVMRLASDLGSDVPFMTVGGVARVLGTGEELRRLDVKTDFTLTLADLGSVDTAACYRKFDELGTGGAPSRNDELAAALAKGELPQALLYNDLTAAAATLNGRVAEAMRSAEAAGMRVVMTGSGGCVYALGDKREIFSLMGLDGKLLRTVARGVEIS